MSGETNTADRSCGDDCPTCGGDGELIGDAADARGERIDEVIDCPDCTPDDYPEEDEVDELGALERWWPQMSAT